jgi:hypothetical protein
LAEDNVVSHYVEGMALGEVEPLSVQYLESGEKGCLNAVLSSKVGLLIKKDWLNNITFSTYI